MSNFEKQYPEFAEILNDLKVQALKEEPKDIKEFAAEYFTKLYKQNHCGDSSEGESEDQFSDDENSDKDQADKDVMTEKKSKKKLIQSSNVPRQSIICEPFDPSSIDNETFEKSRRIFPKTPRQLDKITEILKTIFIFNSLDEEQIVKVIQSMFLIEVLKGDVIIKENDSGDNFYIIDYGKFTASNKNESILEHYNGEGFFGELALLYNCPRAATVVANSDGGLWAIDRITFRQLILKSAYQKRKLFLEFIKSVPILKELSEYDQCNLADALKTKIVNNEKIITEGETGDKMYFIVEGEVMVTARRGEEEEIKDRLHVGQYFGEVALLAKIPRIASVYAIGTTKLAELDVQSYNRLMGPCIERMRCSFANYQSQLKSILSERQMTELFPELF